MRADLVCSAIATALSGLDIAAYEYSPASPPSGWAAYVKPLPFEFSYTFEENPASELMQFQVRLYAPSGNEQSAQQLVMQWISTEGPDSVVAALRADVTLGAVVDSCRVRALGDVGPVQFANGVVVQAADLIVEVIQ